LKDDLQKIGQLAAGSMPKLAKIRWKMKENLQNGRWGQMNVNVRQPYQTHPTAVREQAISLLTTTDMTIEAIGQQLNVPMRTIGDWKLAYERDKNSDVAEIRRQKMDNFISKAWESVEAGLELGKRRVVRAVEKEAELDKMIEIIEEQDDLHPLQKQNLINKLKDLKVHNIRDISTYVGTMFDKIRLAQGESTENVAIKASFEDNVRELLQTIKKDKDD
jgi:hypothetical protein